MVSDSKKVKIYGKEYEVSFPNVGQFYDIESTKQKLGRGYYNTLLGNPTKTAQDALDMIDIEASLTVLVPELIRDMKVKSFSELGLKDYLEIKQIYEHEVYPFLKEAENLLSSIK